MKKSQGKKPRTSAVWVETGHNLADSWLLEGYMCSNCKNMALQDRYNRIIQSKYCPYCGAYMKKEKMS